MPSHALLPCGNFCPYAKLLYFSNIIMGLGLGVRVGVRVELGVRVRVRG